MDPAKHFPLIILFPAAPHELYSFLLISGPWARWILYPSSKDIHKHVRMINRKINPKIYRLFYSGKLLFVQENSC